MISGISTEEPLGDMLDEGLGEGLGDDLGEGLGAAAELSAAALTPAAPAAESGGDSTAATGTDDWTLRFYTSNGDHATAANNYMEEKFKERYPDIEVAVEFGAADYADKVFTMAAADNLPEVERVVRWPELADVVVGASCAMLVVVR